MSMGKFALLLLASGLIGIVIPAFIYIAIRTIKDFRKGLKNDKVLKEKEEKVKMMKERGECHDWIQWTNPFSGEIWHICKKTGFCPTINGFVNDFFLNGIIEQQKLKKEYDEFREARIKTLSQQYSIDIFHMERLVESIFSIKKDFHILKLEELKAELSGSSKEDLDDAVEGLEEDIEGIVDGK